MRVASFWTTFETCGLFESEIAPIVSGEGKVVREAPSISKGCVERLEPAKRTTLPIACCVGANALTPADSAGSLHDRALVFSTVVYALIPRLGFISIKGSKYEHIPEIIRESHAKTSGPPSALMH